MDIITLKEASRRLGISYPTGRLWARQGRFPNAFKLGRVWVVPESDLMIVAKPQPAGRPKHKKGQK